MKKNLQKIVLSALTLLCFTAVKSQSPVADFSVNNNAVVQPANSFTSGSSAVTTIQNLASASVVVDIFPNPNNGEFSVKAKEFSDKTFYAIYNAIGQLVVKEKVNGNSQDVNIKSFPSGSYHLVVFDHNQPIFRTKFVKS